MNRIAVLGGGAFGTALAISLSQTGFPVTLWARDPRPLASARENARYLPGVRFPDSLTVTGDLPDAEIRLLAVPMAALPDLIDSLDVRPGHALVACAKGIDLDTGLGAGGLIAERAPDGIPTVLTGPSFAAEIAAGKPTALTLACADPDMALILQAALSTEVLRLYRTTDVIGAELGGALKNVIAIASGLAIGAGLGDSARAAVMTRGYAEMVRFATTRGALPETLAGLSGLGDLALTCTSHLSRNFRLGVALGAGETREMATTEGVRTAHAVARLAAAEGTDMPISSMVAAVLDERLTVLEATEALMARPLKEE